MSLLQHNALKTHRDLLAAVLGSAADAVLELQQPADIASSGKLCGFLSKAEDSE